MIGFHGFPGRVGRAGGEGLGVEGPDVLDPDLMVNGELEENVTESMSPAIRRSHTTHYILNRCNSTEIPLSKLPKNRAVITCFVSNLEQGISQTTAADLTMAQVKKVWSFHFTTYDFGSKSRSRVYGENSKVKIGYP